MLKRVLITSWSPSAINTRLVAMGENAVKGCFA
jgi:hypothetical protein